MLTDQKLRTQVDALWDKLWTGGLSNPMDAIEQFSYLLFMKRIDDAENEAERRAQRRKKLFETSVPEKMRWRYWTQLPAQEALDHVKEEVFPWLRQIGEEGSSFQLYMRTAEFKINKASLLIEACKDIDKMEISAQNQDVQGDLYEYLLRYLTTAGRNGQFRTPRHIIRMMVRMIDPQPGERIGDLAAGTCGFLINALQHILEQHTPPESLEYDEEGEAHNLTGELLSDFDRNFLQTKALRGFDNDSGMTMLRIGSMNLMLHGIESPQYFYMDTLSKGFSVGRDYDVILMNPPFKGKVDKTDVSDALPDNTTKSELLFVHLILKALDMGGRCAVIVPDGVLFGSSRAHIELREKLIEENRLDGIVSMPSGVFKPYAGVSTAVLLFTKGADTEDIWFYDMAYDGFSLDDKRMPSTEYNDIPDVLECWQNRLDPEFESARKIQLDNLQMQVAPLKDKRLRVEGEINRLIFEKIVSPGDDINGELDELKSKLDNLLVEISKFQDPIDQLSRQFWVSKTRVQENKYDLSASRYREIDQDETYHEEPSVTIERLLKLENVMANEVEQINQLLQ